MSVRRARPAIVGGLSALVLSGCPLGHDLDYERGAPDGGAGGSGGTAITGGGTGAAGGTAGTGAVSGAGGDAGPGGGGTSATGGSGGTGGAAGAGAAGGAGGVSGTGAAGGVGGGSGGTGGAAGAGASGGSSGTGGAGASGGAGGTGGAAGGGGWVTGDYFDLPSGLAAKAFFQPCSSGSDCQANSYCWHPKTAATCTHSKCDIGAKLDWGCDPCVKQICDADPSCCTYNHTCSHSLCTAGARLVKGCDSASADCTTKICNTTGLEYCCQNVGSWDASCVAAVTSACGLSCPLPPTGTWTSACVAKVASICDATCGTGAPPPEEGKCKPWVPGQKDPTCSGVDLALGITCANGIPVCNHGNSTAPAGIRVVHYPANSNQYPKCSPDQAHPQMYECFTTKPIPPGQCVNDLQYWNGSAWTPGCDQLAGSREVMVNPQTQSAKPTPSGYSGYVTECGCQDNWTVYSGGACVSPTCGYEAINVIQAKQRSLFVLMDRSGSMVSSGLWSPAVAGLTAFFQSAANSGLGVAMEFFPMSSGGARGDGCVPGDCLAPPCSNPMVPLGALTSAAAPTDAQEKALVDAFALVHPSDAAAGTGYGTPTHPALQGALDWAIAKVTAAPTEQFDVVFLTDGDPSNCNTASSAAAALAANAYTTKGVRTYAIAMPGSSTAYLNPIAVAGGTTAAISVSAGNMASELQTALGNIAASAMACESDVPPAGLYDVGKTSVVFEPTQGSASALAKRTDKAACGTNTGWYYDNNVTPAKVALCPKSCDDLNAAAGSRVKVSFGCP